MELLPDCYVVKFVLVEISYVVHSKLRCFYLLSDVIKNDSIKTESSGGSVGSMLRSDTN